MKDRHKEFADTYLANGYNARKAYMACYPDCKPNSADVLAYRLLNREDVKEYIDTQRKLMFESRRVDMYRWVEEIANIAFAEKGDMVYTTGDKLKALALLQKYLGLDKQVVEQKTEETINITLED